MSTRKSSSKSFIDKLSHRLQKLEVDKAIGTETTGAVDYDPELAEIQARYAQYKEEKAHRYWHDSYVQGSFEGCNPLTDCIPECRYYAKEGRIEDDEAIADFERGKEKIHPLCVLSVRLSSGCDQCSGCSNQSL